jgi:hypothetical protein
MKKTWQLVELHGCWWAHEGELPPPEAFTTHGRSRNLTVTAPMSRYGQVYAQSAKHPG